MAEHLRACGASGAVRHSSRRSAAADSRVVGKAILYARRSLVVPDVPVPDHAICDPFAIPEIADVPWPGTRIEAGQPVLTVLASGQDIATCEARLRSLEEHWRRRLEC